MPAVVRQPRAVAQKTGVFILKHPLTGHVLTYHIGQLDATCTSSLDGKVLGTWRMGIGGARKHYRRMVVGGFTEQK